jgi:hypothetical protein
VKILATVAVYAGQRPAAPHGISTDSARPVQDEFRFWVGPVRDWRAGRRRASVGGRGRPVSWRTPSAGYSATGTSQVHSHSDLRLSRRSRYRPRVRGTDRPDAGRTPGECPEPRAGSSRPVRSCRAGLLAGVADGGSVRPCPWLSRSAISKSVSKISSLVAPRPVSWDLEDRSQARTTRHRGWVTRPFRHKSHKPRFLSARS